MGVDHSCSAPTGPTPKGWPSPRAFARDLRRHGFAEDEIRTVMRDNGRSLTVRAAGAA